MTIKLYKIKDDRRQLTKTLNAETLRRTMNGQLKSDCSIMDPIIEITYDPIIAGCNYMYIDEFERYYHINNIEVGAQRAFIHAHVDVLQTYAESIKRLSCVIARQQDPEYHSNRYLNDPTFRALQPKRVLTFNFPTSFSTDGAIVMAIGGHS